jgi:putative isomerase
MTTLEDYCFQEIQRCFRPAQGNLQHPFLVPGGIFHDELWDWDSFWIVKGLGGVLDRMSPELGEQFLAHARGSWLDFLDNQAANGAIPIMVKGGEADFFGCTKDSGIEFNHAKPVFGQYALDLARFLGDFTWIAPRFDGLLHFYHRWTSRYGTDCGLLVWGSDVAIGVDNDPTSYGRPEFSSANLLLNCLFYSDLKAASEIARELGREEDAARLAAQAKALGEAIQRECWDPIDRFFYTVDVNVRDGRDHFLPGLNKGMDLSWRTVPVKFKVFTGFLPLWCGLATPEQARHLVEQHLLNTEEFLAPYGITSLARNERMFAPEIDSANPSNWLGPIWIVANYAIYAGLLRYGYTNEAADLASRIHKLLEEDLAKTGCLHECYHPDTGAPNFNARFLSWNVLALLMQPSTELANTTSPR